MGDGLVADIGLCHGGHAQRGLHTGGAAFLLQRVGQTQRVDDGSQHTHLVGAGTLHPVAAVLETAPDVAAADNDGYLYACVDALLDDVTDRADD